MSEIQDRESTDDKNDDNAIVPSEPKELPVQSDKGGDDEISIPEIFESMPPEVRAQIHMMMSNTSIGRSSNHPMMALFEKFTPEHISIYLEGIQTDDDNAHDLKKTNRNYTVFYTVFGTIALGTLIAYMYPRSPEFLGQLLQIFLAIGSGIGAKSYLDKRNGK